MIYYCGLLDKCDPKKPVSIDRFSRLTRLLPSRVIFLAPASSWSNRIQDQKAPFSGDFGTSEQKGQPVGEASGAFADRASGPEPGRILRQATSPRCNKRLANPVSLPGVIVACDNILHLNLAQRGLRRRWRLLHQFTLVYHFHHGKRVTGPNGVGEVDARLARGRGGVAYERSVCRRVSI